MKREKWLSEPACPQECPECSMHCASVVMLLVDLRRDQERLLRDLSLDRQKSLHEELRIVESHLESAGQAFERVRPQKGQPRPFLEAPPARSSALLH